jgi:anti-sigma factor (TIGR02949 family)
MPEKAVSAVGRLRARNFSRSPRDSSSELASDPMARPHVNPRRVPAAHSGHLSSPDADDLPAPECLEVSAKLWDYLDGNCSSELATRINVHLSACQLCLRLLGLQERFLDSLAELRERRPAAARLHVRVRKALANERHSAAQS